MKIIIERFRDLQGRVLYRAMDKKDEFLFIHCANGADAVVGAELRDHVTPMLFAHGVTLIEEVDNA